MLKNIMSQPRLRRAIEGGAVVELHATGGEESQPLLPVSTVAIDCASAGEAFWTVGSLSCGCATSSSSATPCRRSSFLVVIVPHRGSLMSANCGYPRCATLSIANSTPPNTLLAEIEQAIGPCEYRLRFVCDNDEGYELPAANVTMVCGSCSRAEAEACGRFNRVVAFFFLEDDSRRLHTLPRETLIEESRKRVTGASYGLAIDCRLFEDTRDVLRARRGKSRRLRSPRFLSLAVDSAEHAERRNQRPTRASRGDGGTARPSGWGLCDWTRMPVSNPKSRKSSSDEPIRTARGKQACGSQRQ